MTAISVKARNELQHLMDEDTQHRGEPPDAYIPGEDDIEL